ncbi:hypothetical protein OBBRIDRAFT_731347 [Obba rivulosa]|uniref:Uncharacterized protein n=1 Tax=Obba rivulosa TaxID=1052685 RepID=A0A8E2DLR2_9APHY|nr:hypothetical protein OBBRIDRAFT_731347 [Obba rivulosa]
MSRERDRSVSPSVPSVATNTEDGEEESERGARRGSSSTGRGRDEDDAGAESDPEDSETPWTCTLVVRRLTPQSRPHSSIGIPGQPAALPAPAKSPPAHVRPSSSHAPATPGLHAPQTLRVKVAAVVPTPHHPKVVALLKVPFPLPDVEVARARARRRVVTPMGGGPPAQSELVLTAEEIKDVVSATGLWLVVREGFGGVGRERRRGDGWKLRG